MDKGSKHGRPHYLCYQYNSFEFLDLARYHYITGDRSVLKCMSNLSRFLGTGVTASGASAYECNKPLPEVPYYTAVLAAALHTASEMKLGDLEALSQKAFGRLLSQQDDRGGFWFSRKNYGLLSDRQYYPRQLSMILNHLLMNGSVTRRDPAQNSYLPNGSM